MSEPGVHDVSVWIVCFAFVVWRYSLSLTSTPTRRHLLPHHPTLADDGSLVALRCKLFIMFNTFAVVLVWLVGIRAGSLAMWAQRVEQRVGELGVSWLLILIEWLLLVRWFREVHFLDGRVAKRVCARTKSDEESHQQCLAGSVVKYSCHSSRAVSVG